MADTTRSTTSEADARLASLGDFIATQRRAAELSLRQLAERAGISNPYVSQIERGLRRPSAEVLASLAQALQVSAGTLYSYAGVSPADATRPTSVQGAITHDDRLTEQQKKALIQVYLAFVAPGGPTLEDDAATDTPTTDLTADRPEEGEDR